MSLIEDKSMCKNGMYTVNQQTPEPDTPVTLSQAETLELENQSIFSFYESDSLSYLYNAIYYDYERISKENVISSMSLKLISKWFHQVYALQKEGSFKAYEVLYRIGSNLCYIIQEYINQIDAWLQNHRENHRSPNTSDLLSKKALLIAVYKNELVYHELIGKFCLSAIGRSGGQLIDTQDQSYEFHGGSLYQNLSIFEVMNTFMATSIPSIEMTDVFPDLELNTKHYNSAYPTVDDKRHHSYKSGTYTFSNVNVENFVYESSNHTIIGGLIVVVI